MLSPTAFRPINRFYNSCARRLVRLVAKRQGSSGERFRARIACRAASIALVLCLLTSSTPAAPETIVAIAKESSVSFLFWFHASGLAKLIQGRGVGNARAQEKQRDRDAKISRIQIFPSDVNLDLSDHVRFSAVAYDVEGNPVGGVKIKWRGQSAAPGRHVRVSPHGEFEATSPGTFNIVAEAGGKTAQVSVVVRPGVKRDLNQVPTGTHNVSSRDVPSQGIGSIKEPRKARSSAPVASRTGSARDRLPAAAERAHARRNETTVEPAPMPQGGGGGWGDSNYWSADKPPNRVGNPPGAAADGGAGSGNFEFVAPVLGLPGRSISISLAAAYNSRLWNKAGQQISYDNDRGWPAPGFNLGFGKLLGMGVYNGGMLVDADGTRHSYTGSITFYNWGTYAVLHTTDGSFIDYTYWSGTGGGIVSAQAKLANGTVITYGAPGPGAVYPTSILDANGNYITITYVNNAGPRIQAITDTLNRAINFYYDYNNLLTAITAPGLGGGTRTQARFHYHHLGLNPGFSGLTPSVRDWYPWVLDAIYYPSTSTGYWLNDSDSYSSYGMLAKVVEQSSLHFSASSLNDMGSVWQDQTTKTTRKETYNYPLTPDYTITDAPTYTSMTESWTRDGTNFDSATTGYEVYENSFPRTTTITLPNGTKNKQLSYNAAGQWNDGLVYHDETYVTEGQPLQSSTSNWQPGAYDSPRPTRVEKTDERGQMTAAEFSYGSAYNQVTEVRDYDYGGSAPLRSTRTTYQNSASYTNRHIFSLPQTVEVYAPDGTTRLSRTEYQYDGPTMTETPSVVMHSDASNPYAEAEGYCFFEPDWSDPDCTGNCPLICDECIQTMNPCDGYCPQMWVCPYDPSTDYRGNITQVTSYADAINLTGAVTETRRYDITGNRVTTGTSSEQTSFNYTVDTQYAYPVSKVRGSATDAYAQITTGATYDFYTGLGLTATDVNGRQSQTSHDANTLRPTSAISPTGAHTDFAYDDTAMTVTSTTYLAAGEGGSVADQTVKVLNGRGQVRQEQARAPDEGGAQKWDYVDTTFDSMGQVIKQTSPYRYGTTPPNPTLVTYDPLGRTSKVIAPDYTQPDGSATQTFYNEATRPSAASSNPGETTRVQDAWGRERWGRTDASGRLVEVVEPDPSGGGSVANNGMATTYSYNPVGNLTTVNQGSQTRSFKYDSLGRLTAQKLAEASATLNDVGTYVGSGTWGDVFTYDERSNVTSRKDARGVKTVYTYNSDPLNRLQSVSWDTSDFHDSNNPILAAATVTYQYRNPATNTTCDPSGSSGRKDVTQLASASTSGISTESFCYDTEGRASSKTLSLTSRSSYPFVTDYIYDSLDRAKDELYPAEYGNGSAPRKVVHHDCDIASRLTGVTFDSQSQASNIVYNAASQTTSLSVGTGTNQVNESYNYNAQTGVLDSQTVTRGGNTLLSLSYDYTNANGKRTDQLTKISNNQDHNKDRGYQYDALGRLRRATGGQNVNWVQRYNHDRFGNRTDLWSYTADQYVKNFYQSALNRPPDNATELQPKLSALQAAYAQGQTQFLAAMQNVGDTVFASAEYANHNPSDNHQFVRDLYKAYLQREPDSGGWSFWEGQANANGRDAARAGFAWSAEFSLKVNGTSPYSPPGGATVPADGWTWMGIDGSTNRINGAGFDYDAAGNQTRALISSGASQRFQYDAANRLVKVKADDNTTVLATYTYGDSHERLIAEEGAYRTYYDSEDGSVIAEYIESGGSTTPAWSKGYVYLDQRLLSTLTPNGSGGEAVQYHHPDRLGTRLVTDPSSGSSFEQVSLPFGTALSSESTGATSRRFTSYERSGTTGLDYAVNRHYDSQQGRFTQVDPAGMSATSLESPQTLNLYAYCANDPINRTDPSGLGFFSFLKKVFKWIVVAVTVVVAVLTIVYTGQIQAAIGLVKAVLALIAAVANAASSVLTALGLKTAGMVFDIIAAGASFGFSLASIAGKGLEKVKTIFKAIQDGATLASKTLSAFGHKMIGQVLDLAASVAGFISSGIRSKNKGPIGFHPKNFDIYKFVRGTAEKIANLAGAARFGGFLNVLGLVDDAGDLYFGIRDFNAAGSGPISLAKVLSRTAGGIPGDIERLLPLIKKVNTAFGRIDKAIALAH